MTIVDVGVGVILRKDGHFLMGERTEGKVYAGYWEFPGGKVEHGESPREALVRELHEELGIDVHELAPWQVQEFTYPHATVRLHFFHVTGWHGEPHGKEDQRLAWCDPLAAPLTPMLPANTTIFDALRGAGEFGTGV